MVNSLIILDEYEDEGEIARSILNQQFKFPNYFKISKSCIFLLRGMLEKNYHYRIDLDSQLFDQWYNDE